MGDRVPRSGMTAPAFRKPAFGRLRRRPWRGTGGTALGAAGGTALPASRELGLSRDDAELGRGVGHVKDIAHARDVVSYVEAATRP